MPGYPDYAVGVDEQFYVVKEASYGAFVVPAAANGIRIIQSTFTPSKERVPRRDKLETRSRIGRITRKTSVEWSGLAYHTPSGTRGTEPDSDLLWENFFGTTTVDASGVRYSELRDQTESLSLHRICDHFAESIVGAVVNAVTVSISGTEEPTLEFSGMAADYIRTGTGTLSASAASGAGTVTVTDGADLFDQNSYVEFYVGGTAYNNSDAGYRVTADPTTATIAISPVLEDDIATAATIRPFFPNATVQGQPINCLNGSAVVDSNTLQITSGTITLTNNFTMRNDFLGEAVAVGYSVNGYRDVDISLTGWMQTSYAKYLFKSENFAAQATTITLGTGSGTVFVITMTYAEYNVIPIEIPEEDLVSFTLTGKALGDSGEDECYVDYT